MKLEQAKNPKWTKEWWDDAASKKTKPAKVGDALKAFVAACRTKSSTTFRSEQEFTTAVEACDLLLDAIGKAKKLCDKKNQKETLICLATYETECEKTKQAVTNNLQTWREVSDEEGRLAEEEKVVGPHKKAIKDGTDELNRIQAEIAKLPALPDAARARGQDVSALQELGKKFNTGVRALEEQLNRCRASWDNAAKELASKPGALQIQAAAIRELSKTCLAALQSKQSALEEFLQVFKSLGGRPVTAPVGGKEPKTTEQLQEDEEVKRLATDLQNVLPQLKAVQQKLQGLQVELSQRNKKLATEPVSARDAEGFTQRVGDLQDERKATYPKWATDSVKQKVKELGLKGNKRVSTLWSPLADLNGKLSETAGGLEADIKKQIKELLDETAKVGETYRGQFATAHEQLMGLNRDVDTLLQDINKQIEASGDGPIPGPQLNGILGGFVKRQQAIIEKRRKLKPSWFPDREAAATVANALNDDGKLSNLIGEVIQTDELMRDKGKEGKAGNAIKALQRLNAGGSPPAFAAVLQLKWPCTYEDVKKAYKRLSLQNHPDRGGDEAKFKEVNTANEQAKDFFGA